MSDNCLADDIREEIIQRKIAHGADATLSADDILGNIQKLQKQVIKLRGEGISVWNASSKIPAMFDIIDGAFVILNELALKLKEGERK